jgi:hypothetical protein
LRYLFHVKRDSTADYMAVNRWLKSTARWAGKCQSSDKLTWARMRMALLRSYNENHILQRWSEEDDAIRTCVRALAENKPELLRNAPQGSMGPPRYLR